jgi:hypothetical protein
MTVTAASITAPRRHRSAVNIGIALVALAGVPAIWLPFAYGITPAGSLFDDLWPLAWPHLLAIPIAAALVRWVASGRLSNSERWCGRAFAAGACCVTGSLFVEPLFDGSWPSDADGWTTFVAALAMLAGGAALSLRVLRSGEAPGGLDAIVMMELAYLPNVALCVLAAAGGGERLQIGAYAVLLTAAAYGTHVLAVLSGTVASRSRRADSSLFHAPEEQGRGVPREWSGA